MAIEAVLFDYSGVLTSPLDMPTDDVPYDPDLLFSEMVQALSSQEPHPWHALERGEITLAAFALYVEERVPGGSVLFATGSEHNVMNNLAIIDDHLAVVAELKARGRRVGLVTNNVAEWQPYWLPRLPEGLFELVIDSADVGCRKPEPAIYQLALERLDVEDASTVLFVDDFEWNVRGAEQIGMVGHHHRPDTDLRAELSAVLANSQLG